MKTGSVRMYIALTILIEFCLKAQLPIFHNFIAWKKCKTVFSYLHSLLHHSLAMYLSNELLKNFGMAFIVATIRQYRDRNLVLWI